METEHQPFFSSDAKAKHSKRNPGTTGEMQAYYPFSNHQNSGLEVQVHVICTGSKITWLILFPFLLAK